MNNTLEENRQKLLKNELTALEGRVTFARAENERLSKETVSLKTEVEEIRSKLTQDIATRQSEVRRQAGLVDDDCKKLVSDKQEFEGILVAFKKERVEFEREKQALVDLKKDAQMTTERCYAFIRMVRDGAAKL